MGSIRVRLVLQYAAVVLLSTALVWGGTLWATRVTFRAYVSYQHLSVTGSLVPALAEYYAREGSWDGVDTVLHSAGMPGHGRGWNGRGKSGIGGMGGAGMGPASAPSYRAVLFDASGTVVFDGYPWAGSLPKDADERATDVIVNGAKVGSFLVTGTTSGVLGALEEDFLGRFRTALSLIAFLSLVLAILLGLRLSAGISRPIERLRDLSSEVAQGRFEQRVDLGSDGAPIEVKGLIASFNSMARDLESAEHQRRELLRDLSHEIRTPLTILSGNLEAITSGAAQLDPETVVAMSEEIARLEGLVKDLDQLDRSSSDRGTGISEVDPSMAVERAVASITGAALSKNVEVKEVVEEGLPAVRADAERIQQVFANVLSNALRYVPVDGEITVLARTERRDSPGSRGEVVFSVHDSGPGFPEEYLHHVFDRFFRADPSRSRLTGGSGLGLSIAKSIVEEWGGRIWAGNHRDGGAVVSFTVPVWDGTATGARDTT